MKLVKSISFIILLIGISACAQSKEENAKVEVGADLIVSADLNLIDGKNVGIIANHTAVLSNGTHLVDTLHSLGNVNVVALFGPEHGIRGDVTAGGGIDDAVDAKTGIPIYSLYGKIRKPTKEMLEGIDVLMFDIQDVGSRFYTYISTMYNCIEAAAENDLPIIILDRPNPITGVKVDGPLRDDEFKSFVAIAPIPIMHGMTVGELANLFNQDILDKTGHKANVQTVLMKNWKRNFYYNDCNLKWVKPSPNMPDPETAEFYPGMCFLEGVNISEARGTYYPFKAFGAPFIDAVKMKEELMKYDTPGIEFDTTSFIPMDIESMSENPRYEGEKCYGLKLTITDRDKFEPVKFGVYVLAAIHDLYPDSFEFRRNWLDKLFGKTYFREMLIEGKSANEIIARWQDELEKFKESRKKYLLY